MKIDNAGKANSLQAVTSLKQAIISIHNFY